MQTEHIEVNTPADDEASSSTDEHLVVNPNNDSDAVGHMVNPAVETTLLNPSKTTIDKSESANVDSFWVDPITNDHLLHEEEINIMQASPRSVSSGETENSALVFSNYQDPDMHHNKDQEKVSGNNKLETASVVDQNANDTDLDQTFNLNASYEIVPHKKEGSDGGANSPNNLEASYDIVNKIIDCSQVDSDNEDRDNNVEKEDLNATDEATGDQKNAIVFMQASTTIIADEEQILTEPNEEIPEDLNNQNDSDDEEENLTVIIPEELNKIVTFKEPTENTCKVKETIRIVESKVAFK